MKKTGRIWNEEEMYQSRKKEVGILRVSDEKCEYEEDRLAQAITTMMMNGQILIA